MDHDRAIDSQAAERYLLGELSAADAEDFELHFFECPDCALAVEFGGLVIDNARAVFSEPARLAKPAKAQERSSQSFWGGLKLWIPLTAAVAFGVVAIYQGTVVIPELSSPRELPSFQLVGASRGETPRISVPRGAPSFALSADIPPDVHSDRYAAVLTTGSQRVFHLIVSSPPPGQPITILAPAKVLSPGKYEFSISALRPDGTEGDRIAAFPFDFLIN